MYSGNISENTATQFGGGVQTGGVFTMRGGTISDNTGTLYGGGVLVFGTGVFNMFGGEITKNIVPSGNGGGVYALYGDANISNGTISENRATTGAGIYVGSNRNVNVSGTSHIINNIATGNGGGIYVTINGKLNIADTSYIENNVAGNDGGGIYTANTEYSNIITNSKTVFNGNKASAVYVPPTDASTLYANIGFASTSITTHPLNNYDINYRGTLLTFNITYNANGGVGTHIGPNITPENIDRVLPLADTGISREGYSSIEWNDKSDGSGTKYNSGDSIVLNDNITLYAQWEANQYTATFESNGGTTVDRQIVPFGGLVIRPNNPIREGYTFEGWYTDNGIFLNQWDFNTAVTDNITIYAKWLEISECIVSFECNGGTLIDSQKVAIGGLAVKPDAPTREGYIFEGWYTDNGTFSNQFDFNTIITEDITLYAEWLEIDEYTVKFECNGGTLVDSQTVPVGGLAVRPDDPTRERYIFEGWYTDNRTFSNQFDFNTTITEDITLYAEWLEIGEYTVSFESNGGTYIESKIISSGNPVVRPTDPIRQGYIFEGWYTDNETFLNQWDFNTTVVEDMILYAKWVINPNFQACNCKCIWIFIIFMIVILFLKRIERFIKYMNCKCKYRKFKKQY